MLFASLFATTFVILPILFQIPILYVALFYTFVFLILPTITGLLASQTIDGVWVIENSRLMHLLNLDGLAIYPVVFMSELALTDNGNCTWTFRHERIHLAQ